MLIGVDEAGRGPVIGPMIVCALSVEDERKLLDLGIRDSKKLSSEKREYLSKEIRKISNLSLVEVSAREIDSLRKSLTLNDITIQKFAQAILKIPKIENAERIFVDSCDVDERRFASNLLRFLNFDCELVAEHGADERYPIVAAASVIAKVSRDERISEFKRLGFEVGSGYPSDEKTINFLKKYMKKNRELPDFVRRSWKTVERLKQGNLDSYL
ncbi:MAG: ribonuclease HII [Candidatus Methanofastidiosia archaeon]